MICQGAEWANASRANPTMPMAMPTTSTGRAPKRSM